MHAMFNGRSIRTYLLVMMIGFVGVGCSSSEEQQDKAVSQKSPGTSPVKAGTKGVEEKRASSQGSLKKGSNEPAQKQAQKSSQTSKKVEPSASASTSLPGTVIPVASNSVFSDWPRTADGLELLAVAAVGGLNELESVLSLVNGPPKKKGDVANEAIADFKKKFGFKDASWLRKDGPMYVILSDIREDSGGRALVLPVGDEKALKKAAKKFQKKGSKHLGDLTVDGKKAYLDLVGDQAVITYADDFFLRLKPYLEGAFKAYQASGIVELRFNVATLRKMYGKDLAGSKGWIKKNIADLVNLENLQGPSEKSLEDIVDLLQDAVDSVSEIGIALTIDKGEMSILFGVVPEKGHSLERIVKSMATLRSELGTSIHPKPLVMFGGRTDSWAPDEIKEQSEEMVSRLSTVLSMEADEKAQLRMHYESLAANQTGDAIFQLYQDGEFPVAFGLGSVVNDTSTERNAHQGFVAVMFKILMRNLKVQLKDNRMARLFLRGNSFGELFRNMAFMTKPLGLKLEVSSGDVDGTLVDSFHMKMDWNKVPMVDRIPNVEIVRQVVGGQLSVAAAYRGKRSAIVFGPNAADHAKKMVAEKGFGETSAIAQAMKTHAIAGEVRLASIMKLVLKYTEDRPPFLLALSAMSDEIALNFKAKSDGSKAIFRVTVPTPVLRAFR